MVGKYTNNFKFILNFGWTYSDSVKFPICGQGYNKNGKHEWHPDDMFTHSSKEI